MAICISLYLFIRLAWHFRSVLCVFHRNSTIISHDTFAAPHFTYPHGAHAGQGRVVLSNAAQLIA